MNLRDLAAYFLRLGALGFGGPIALAGYMQRDLVEERRWFTKEEYVEGLALAQLAPGPLAAQLAIYLGWVRGRVLGATVVAAAFILPSFVMVLALSALYLRFGGLAWMQGVFYGVGAAVIAIIARSAVKLVKLTLARDRLLWALFAANAVVTAWTESEVIWVFALSGVVALVARQKSPVAVIVPAFLFTGLHGVAAPATLATLGLYFAEAGAFVFGSGLAIVPFLHGGVVEKFGWLTDRQFLDAVAVAMITPGPVVITVAFIGYLVAGPVGACVASLGVFLPCWLFVVIPAPYYRRIAGNRSIKAFVDGVTAAATGTIAGAAFVLGRRAIVDLSTATIALGTLLALLRVRKAPEPLVILGAGLVGLLLVSGCERRPAPSPDLAVVSFRADVAPELDRYCAAMKGCHGDEPTDSVALDLRPARARAELVGRAAKARPSALRVAPGDAAASFLVVKITGPLAPREGKRMPLDENTGAPVEPNPVSEQSLERLRRWIREGARDN